MVLFMTFPHRWAKYHEKKIMIVPQAHTHIVQLQHG
jgi:hypothetical protein